MISKAEKYAVKFYPRYEKNHFNTLVKAYLAGLTESRKENEALRELLERAKYLIDEEPFEYQHAIGWVRDYEKFKAGKE